MFIGVQLKTTMLNEKKAVNKAENQAENQAASELRLLADIGGTNARFALVDEAGVIAHVRRYRCADYADIVQVIQAYLSTAQLNDLQHAAIAIANPVEGDQVKMTNHDWAFSIEATRRALNLQTFLVVNDFTALAMALPLLTETQRIQIGTGTPRANHALGLIGPGTGLGVSGLIPTAEGWVALASEGGHTSFAPCDERDDYILQYARQHWQHVSFERVAAGPGIALIYRALAARAKHAIVTDDPAKIAQLGVAGEPLAAETLDCFCGILGTFAGNLACTLGALGGIYIGGGIVPRLPDFFAHSSFRARFEAKGRFSAYLAQIPTYLVTAENPTLLGVSALLAKHLNSVS